MLFRSGFFVADAIGDIVEVRIKSQFGVNSIKAGDQSAEQMSYVVIKDCGVAGIDSLEGNLVAAPEPTGPDTFGTNHLFIGDYAVYSSTAALHVGINGNSSNGGIDTTHLPAIRPGKFVEVTCNVIVNGSLAATNIFTRVGITEILVGSIPAGQTGVFRFTASQAFLLEDRISVVVKRTDSNLTVVMLTDIECDFGLSGEKLVIGATSRIAGQLPQFANIISPPCIGTAGTGQGVEEIWAGSFERDGIKIGRASCRERV